MNENEVQPARLARETGWQKQRPHSQFLSKKKVLPHLSTEPKTSNPITHRHGIEIGYPTADTPSVDFKILMKCFIRISEAAYLYEVDRDECRG